MSWPVGEAAGGHTPHFPPGPVWLIPLVAVLLSLIFTSYNPLFGASPPASRQDGLPERFGDLVPRLMDRYDIPGAGIALIQDGEVTWSEYYGWANVEDEEPVTEATLFRAESITKAVTAWAVMHLVEEGHVDLDAPVLYAQLGIAVGIWTGITLAAAAFVPTSKS